MKSKLLLLPLLAVALVCIIGGAFLAGFTVGNSTPALLGRNTQPAFPNFGEILPFNSQPSANGNADSATQTGTPEDLQSLFTPFWEAWNAVHDEYVDP